MKKVLKPIVPAILLMILLTLSIPAFAAGSGVVDSADVFTEQEELQIEQWIAQFQSQTNMDFVMYTSATPHPGKSGMAVGQDFYDYNGYGLDEQNSGILYFIDMAERYPYLITTGKMIDYMTDERLDVVLNVITNDLRNGDFLNSVYDAANRTLQYIKKGIPEGQYRYDKTTGERLTGGHQVITGTEILFSAVAGLIVCMIIIKSVNHGYKLQGSTYQYDYAANGSAELTDCQDEYLRTTTNRVRKVESSFSGGSGGGGHIGGSGVSSGSSGISHGGGRGGSF